MQFKVPQFLDIEDKIFGPFTFSEFVYLVGGGGICYVLYKILGLFFGAIPILIVGGFAIALVFYKPNNKPFIDMVESGIKYMAQDKLYIYKKNWEGSKKNQKNNMKKEKTEIQTRTQRLSGSKLKDLAWSLDVLDLKK